jgi:hypothetical protein
MKTALLLLVACAILLPSVAMADCAMEADDLRAKIARIPDKAKRLAANGALNKNMTAARGSETECLNGLTRTRRLMSAPDAAPVKKPEPGQVNWN